MFKTDKLAVYFIIAVASFQCWYSSFLPAGADEAYLFLKSSGTAWFSLPHPGVGVLGINLASTFSDNIFALRLASVVMMSFAAIFIFKSANLLGGRIAAWAALILFMLTPAVNMAYVSATPAACFILFSAIGFFFWLNAFETGKLNYYLGAGASSGVLVMTHWAGFFLFAFVLAYLLFFNRKLLLTKNFLIACIFFMSCPVALLVAGFFGLNIAPGSVPFIFTESKNILLGLGIIGSPVIFYALVMLLFDRFRTSEFNFLQFSFLGGLALFIVLNFTSNIDIRYSSAFFMPAFILAGAYFVRKDNKIFLGVIMAIAALLSAYLKIAQKENLYLPSGIKTTSIYAAIDIPLGKVVGNSGAVFAKTIPEASLYAFYTTVKPAEAMGENSILIDIVNEKKNKGPAKHPEACTFWTCSKNRGAFVADTKEFDPKTLFPNTEYYGIFRLTTPKDGTKSFYIYSVK